jgi:hypothetical protein
VNAEIAREIALGGVGLASQRFKDGFLAERRAVFVLFLQSGSFDFNANDPNPVIARECGLPRWGYLGGLLGCVTWVARMCEP